MVKLYLKTKQNKTKHKTYLLSKRNSFLKKDKDRLKIKRWKKIYHANTSHKKAGVKILILHNVDFKTRNITRDKRDILNYKGLNSPRRRNNPKCVYT